MKKIGLVFVGAALSVMAAFGAGAFNHTDRVEKAEAATSSRTITVRIDAPNWYNNGTYFDVHIYGGDATDSRHHMTAVSVDDHLYSVTVSISETTSIQFVRCSSTWEAYDWSGSTSVSDCDYFILNNDNGGWHDNTITASYSNGTYLRGAFNSWGAHGQLKMSVSDKDGYSVMLKDFASEADKMVKVVYYTDGDFVWGGNASGETTSDDQTNYPCYNYDNGDGVNGWITVAGTYNIYVNTTTNKYFFVSPTGRYADRFLEEILCPGEVYSGGSAQWTLMSGLFTSTLNEGAQETFQTATANEKGTNVQHAVARYDAVIRHYGVGTYANFMSRTISPAPSGALMNRDIASASFDSTFAIALIAIVSVLSVGVFVFLKKKKTI